MLLTFELYFTREFQFPARGHIDWVLDELKALLLDNLKVSF